MLLWLFCFASVIAISEGAVACYSFPWLHTSTHGLVFSSVTSPLRFRMLLNLGQQTKSKVLGNPKMSLPKLCEYSERAARN